MGRWGRRWARHTGGAEAGKLRGPCGGACGGMVVGEAVVSVGKRRASAWFDGRPSRWSSSVSALVGCTRTDWRSATLKRPADNDEPLPALSCVSFSPRPPRSVRLSANPKRNVAEMGIFDFLYDLTARVSTPLPRTRSLPHCRPAERLFFCAAPRT